MARKKSSNTKRFMLEELCNRGMTKVDAFEILRPLVESQTRPMIYSENVGGGRVPLSVPEQLTRLKEDIGRNWCRLGRSENSDFDSAETPAEQDFSESADEEVVEDADEDTEDEIPPVAAGKKRIHDEWQKFVTRVREVRRFCIDRERMQSKVDDISQRPMQAAQKLIPAGVSADVLLLAMTMHWSPETRRDAGIDSFDFNVEGKLTPHPEFLRISQRVMREREIPTFGKHCLFGYALLICEAGIPLMLVGPAGTGKSHLAEQLSDFMNRSYAETPMAAGASRGDLLGRHTISREKPFVGAEFTAQYSSGGFFSFEEMDRADPSVVVTLNNALARNRLFNPVDGERYEKHENFVPVATANTFGIGANSSYTAAERMDLSVLDRFRMGRVFIPIDEKLEEEIFRPQF